MFRVTNDANTSDSLSNSLCPYEEKSSFCSKSAEKVQFFANQVFLKIGLDSFFQKEKSQMLIDFEEVTKEVPDCSIKEMALKFLNVTKVEAMNRAVLDQRYCSLYGYLNKGLTDQRSPFCDPQHPFYHFYFSSREAAQTAYETLVKEYHS